MKNLILTIALTPFISGYAQNFSEDYQSDSEYIERHIGGLNICDLKTNKYLIGTWNVTEGDEVFDARITIEEDNSVSVFYGSPLVIYGKLVEKNDTCSIIGTKTFDATMSMYQIIDSIIGDIDDSFPIGTVKVISPEVIELIWLGYKIKEDEPRWLSNLDDEVFWGYLPIKQGTNKIILTKVK